MDTQLSAIVLALVLVLCQTAKRREWSLVGLGILRRLKNRTWLARIRIQAKEQKFGRQRTQIDGAANERFRIIPFDPVLLAFVIGGFRKSMRRFEYEIDRLFDLIGQGFEGYHAILSDGRRDRSDDMQAAAAAGNIETGFKSRQFAQAGGFRHSSAHVRIGGKIEMLAGLGNLLSRQRDMPWCGRSWRGGSRRGGFWRLVLGHRNGLRIGENNSAAQ